LCNFIYCKIFDFSYGMDNQLFSFRNSTIGYFCFGNGPGTVICFHGFGEDAMTFEFLEKHAGHEFTFYALDLPFHGQTIWNEGLLFTHNDLLKIIDGVLHSQNQNPEAKSQKLILLGFSLGGRIALSLYQAIPEQVDKIVLLAPDGLKINFWYWFATQTWMGNKFFAFTMKKPGWFFSFLKILNKVKLVNTSVFKFVNYYIGKKDIRLLLYRRWTTLRKLKPNLFRIKSIIRKQATPVRLVYGRHDRIILSSVGEKFRKEIEEYSTLTIIESGHQVLHEKYVKEIIESLKS
jgi:pimeloyl-ACP methyl ester carboxylesterase